MPSSLLLNYDSSFVDTFLVFPTRINATHCIQGVQLSGPYTVQIAALRYAVGTIPRQRL